MTKISVVKLAALAPAMYAKFNPRQYRQMRQLGRGLKGVKIFHINSTAIGGGVAEILKSQVPLERGLGLDSKWLVIPGTAKFFGGTKKIHNLLQGQSGALSPQEKKLFLTHLKKLGPQFTDILSRPNDKKIVVIHDPQPLPLINFIPPSVPVVSRLHIDLSHPNPLAVDFLKPFVTKAHRLMVSDRSFVFSWYPASKTVISYPAIDPLTLKNRPLSKNIVNKILRRLKINPNQPLIVQVSRFDAWKDPLGVIEAYYQAKKPVPNLQLVLKGDMAAADDPEALEVYYQIKRQYDNDPNIFLLADPKVPTAIPYGQIINALQAGADIVIQKSLREGFGLTCTEAMWKGKPVIAGNVGGLKRQIKNGVSGILVNSPIECGQAIIDLLRHPQKARRLGKQARISVQEKFLLPRLVLDCLKIYSSLV